MDTLKDCPFCGGVATHLEQVADYLHTKNRQSIACGKCWIETEQSLDVEDAIEAWNKRVK